MQIKSLSELLVEHIDFFFSKNELFQSLIVISIIFDCSHSGPAQESTVPMVGSLWEQFYRKRIVSD